MFYVDVPNPHRPEWEFVAEFKSRDEAIAYAKKHYGADDEGKVCLISEVQDLDEDSNSNKPFDNIDSSD